MKRIALTLVTLLIGIAQMSAQWGNQGIQLDASSLELLVGTKHTFTVSQGWGWGVDNSQCTWSTSNSSVATIADGTVTGVALGSCTITCKYTDQYGGGTSTATCSIKVVEPMDPPFQTTTITGGEFDVETQWYLVSIRGGKYWYADATNGNRISCGEAPTQGTDATKYLWCFTGSKSTGYRIHNYAEGADYFFSAFDVTNQGVFYALTQPAGGDTGYYHVWNNTSGGFTLSSVDNQTACLNDFNNESYIAYWVSGSAPNDGGSNITFQEVLAEDYGGEHIGDVIDVTAVNISATTLSLAKGETAQLTATVLPEDATYRRLTWATSDMTVATVQDGLITARSLGTCTITATSRNGITASCEVTVHKPINPDAIENLGTIRYLTFLDGQMVAIPEKYILAESSADGVVSLTLEGDTVWTYSTSHLASSDTTCYSLRPEITSFKFNNKFNDQLYTDVHGEIDSITHDIILRVPCIGKRLTASFQVSEGARVWCQGEHQISKVTRRRFDNELIYTVAFDNNWIWSATRRDFMPFGTDYYVNVDYLTDHPTNEYSVPRIDINTFDGTMISSKDRYWDASFEIQGYGVFPDLKIDTMQIKGRGNSSWSNSTSSKNPYRLKFAEKIKPFGLTKGKNWVLLANKQTGSLTTNAIAMKIADMVESEGCNHIVPCELYINGQYRGNYNFTEKVGFHNNSIDVDETHAVMLELDSYYDEPYKFRDANYNLYVNVHDPELDDGVERDFGLTEIQNRFNALTAEMKSTNTTYDECINVPSVTRAMLVTDLVRNTELMHPKSWFLYTEDILQADSAWYFGPVWDFDWSYGYENTQKYFVQYADIDIFQGMDANRNVGYPFFKQLLRGNKVMEKAYYREWTNFIQSGKLEELIEFVDDYFAYVEPSFLHNATKWSDGSAYGTTNENAKTWLAQRANYIYNNLTPYDLSPDIDDPDADYGEPDRVSLASILHRPVDVYTIRGIQVRSQVPVSSATQGLQPGIYIVDGHKVLVK